LLPKFLNGSTSVKFAAAWHLQTAVIIFETAVCSNFSCSSNFSFTLSRFQKLNLLFNFIFIFGFTVNNFSFSSAKYHFAAVS